MRNYVFALALADSLRFFLADLRITKVYQSSGMTSIFPQ